MIKRFLAIAILGTVTSQSAQANQVNPWQDCGIGAMVFPNNGAAAAVSNIIWDLGTTAISTKISSAEDCSGTNVKTAMFIKQTYPSLEQEIAQGEGEYISAMLSVRGCDIASHSQIVAAVRGDFAQQSTRTAEGLYNLVEQNIATDFARQCSAS